MSKSGRPAPNTLFSIATRTRAELVIILVCLGFYTQTGLSTARVFDIIGPELIPKFVIGLIAALAVLEIVLTILRGQPVDDNEREKTSTPALIAVVLFVASTVGYLVLLVATPSPYYLATAAYFACTSLVIVGQVSIRELVVGVGVGLLIGGALQFLFTQIFVIDLPT